MGTLTFENAIPALDEPSGLGFYDLGLIEFLDARAFQESLILKRVRGESQDALIVCEHPAVVTLGKNFPRANLGAAADEIVRRGASIQSSTRGGKATFHGPGQLVVYPVVSLKERRMGIRDFVCGGLCSIARALSSFGLNARVELTEPGVWQETRKIAAVGLSVVRAVTNHGFSINVSNTLEFFRLFSPCGLHPDQVGRICDEIRTPPGLKQVSSEVYKEFSAWLSS